MAGVDRQPVDELGAARPEWAGGDEASELCAVFVHAVRDDTQQGGRPVVLAEPTAEARSADEAAPGLARDGGAHEPRGVVRRDVEEDLLHELVHQRRRLPRGHAAGGAGFGAPAPAAEERGFGDLGCSGMRKEKSEAA